MAFFLAVKEQVSSRVLLVGGIIDRTEGAECSTTVALRGGIVKGIHFGGFRQVFDRFSEGNFGVIHSFNYECDSIFVRCKSEIDTCL